MISEAAKLTLGNVCGSGDSLTRYFSERLEGIFLVDLPSIAC